ncbi:hypothetical protein [Croceibacterium ferulae]|uniref:hypothetical protein n=1 Tax=Croceibacterium ferulae TaxID=1854641 RepID=UPI000EB58E2D|nr:hypothetical protein [Croceibacterium ferulae]
MKSILALIAALVAAIMTIASPAALAMGQTQTVPESNQPVPAAEAQHAATFNSCVSRQYSAKSNRSAAVNNAMGKYRDTYTLVERARVAKNLPEFNRHLRDAQIQAADVGTTCTL